MDMEQSIICYIYPALYIYIYILSLYLSETGYSVYLYLLRCKGNRGMRMKTGSVLHPSYPISIQPKYIIGLDSEVGVRSVRP